MLNRADLLGAFIVQLHLLPAYAFFIPATTLTELYYDLLLPTMVQDWTRDSLPRHQTFQPQYYSTDTATRHQSFSSERYTSDVVQRHHPFPQERVGVETDNARFQDGNDSRRHLMVSLHDYKPSPPSLLS